MIALALALIGLTLGAIWGWPEGFLITVLSGLSAAESMWRRTRPPGEPVLSVFLDITSIYLGMSIARVPDSAIGVVFTYLVLSSLLLLRPRIALTAMVYSALWYVVLVRDMTPRGGELTETQVIATGAITATFFLVAFVGMVSVMIQIMNRDSARRTRRARMQQAIASASKALLDDRNEDALETSLKALLEATDALSVFVDKNLDNPELGFCSSSVIQVVREGESPSDGKGTLVPWSSLSGKDALAAGESHVIRFSELEGDERVLYSGGRVQSELNIPIFVDGEWWGVIGFTDDSEKGHWYATDERLLFAAADMIGAYVGRSGVQTELESLVSDLDSQLRYQYALAECARLLQASEAPAVMANALAALLNATSADFAYIDENHTDPVRGEGYRIIHYAGKPDSQGGARAGEHLEGFYEDTPTAYSALRAGKPIQVVASKLEGSERESYLAKGIISELSIPIEVSGAWSGSMAFVDYEDERDWSDDEVGALLVGAQMMGNFWERQEAQSNLAAMIESQGLRLRYEEAISNCSKALLTSDDESAIEMALLHLMEATDTHKVFVDTNVEDPESGLVGVVIHEVIRDGYDALVEEEIWEDPETGQRVQWQLPYSQLPDLENKLRSGQPAVVIPRALPEPQQVAYVGDPCKTELNIPIMSRGQWIGSIGFADYLEERSWAPEEIALLQTAAEMISAFWDRIAAKRRLEELIRSKDEFVASVSHELRTPLTSVVGLSAELRDRDGQFSDEEKEYLIGVIAEQSTEVADIVNDLLVAARTDIGTLAVHLQSIDVGEAIESIVRSRLLEAFEEVDIGGDEAIVLADPVRLRQILRNLMVNAARYGGDALRITTFVERDHAVVKVSDNGGGVHPNSIAKIFEPYGRAHNNVTQPESLGLGLAVARGLARLMGGDLEYQRHGTWTEFALTLPLARESARRDS